MCAMRRRTAADFSGSLPRDFLVVHLTRLEYNRLVCPEENTGALPEGNCADRGCGRQTADKAQFMIKKEV